MRKSLTVLVCTLLLSIVALAEVDPVSGNYQRSWIDYGRAGVTHHLRLVRTYHAATNADSRLFGHHWCSNWEVQVLQVSLVELKLSSCPNFKRYRKSGELNLFLSETDPLDSIQVISDAKNRKIFRRKFGDEYTQTFSSEGILTNWNEISSGFSLDFKYSDNGRQLAEIHASNGEDIKFKYTDGLVTDIRTQSVVVASYKYSDGNLVESTSSQGKKSKLQFDGSGDLTEISGPGERPEKITYSDKDKSIAELVASNGCVSQYTFGIIPGVKKAFKTTVHFTCPKQTPTTVTYEMFADQAGGSYYLKKQTITVKGSATELEYEPKYHHLISMKSGQREDHFKYDEFARLKVMQSSLGFNAGFDYDSTATKAPSEVKVQDLKTVSMKTYSIKYDRRYRPVFLQPEKAEQIQLVYNDMDRLHFIHDNSHALEAKYSLATGRMVQIQGISRRPAASTAPQEIVFPQAKFDEWTRILEILAVARHP